MYYCRLVLYLLRLVSNGWTWSTCSPVPCSLHIRYEFLLSPCYLFLLYLWTSLTSNSLPFTGFLITQDFVLYWVWWEVSWENFGTMMPIQRALIQLNHLYLLEKLDLRLILLRLVICAIYLEECVPPLTIFGSVCRYACCLSSSNVAQQKVTCHLSRSMCCTLVSWFSVKSKQLKL